MFNRKIFLSAMKQILLALSLVALLVSCDSGEKVKVGDSKKGFAYYRSYQYLKPDVEKFSKAFGIERDKLSRIMACHLTEDNLLQGGLFDQMISTLDRARAKETMERIEGVEIKVHRVAQKAEGYLKRFILSRGDISVLDGRE